MTTAGVLGMHAPAFAYPDTSAHGLPGREEATYHVEFSASELWGDAAEAGAMIVVDLWNSYLTEAS